MLLPMLSHGLAQARQIRRNNRASVNLYHIAQAGTLLAMAGFAVATYLHLQSLAPFDGAQSELELARQSIYPQDMLDHVHAAQGHLGQLGSFAGQDAANRNLNGLDQMLQAAVQSGQQPGSPDYSASYAGLQHAVGVADTKVGIAKTNTDGPWSFGYVVSAALSGVLSVFSFVYKPALSGKVLAR